MKIVFLARRFYPDIGGVEKHVLEIGKLMVDDGHKVTVVTQSKGNQNELNGISIKRITSSTNKYQLWKEIVSLRHLVKESAPPMVIIMAFG